MSNTNDGVSEIWQEVLNKVAAELRRLHAENEALRAALKQPGAEVPKERVREIFMNHGFTIKGGQTDLKPYVYNAAYALLNAAPKPAQQADTRTTAIQSCIDRLIFGGQPAAAQILRHHFAKDLGEE